MTPSINAQQDAPTDHPMIGYGGKPSIVWAVFFTLVSALLKRFLLATTFANLPAANSTVNNALVNRGKIAIVTDSTVNTFGAIVAGGGANVVLCWSNGTNWTVIGI